MGKQIKGPCATKDNIHYTGRHLLAELWGARKLDSLKEIEKCLIAAVKVTKTHLLELKLHHFSPNHGISGVAIISGSHISIHTWPEFNYAAIDIFVHGKVSPYKSISVFKKYLAPTNLQISEVKRGILR